MARGYGAEGISIQAAAEFKPALERALKLNKPCVIVVQMQNVPTPTTGQWNIMEISSPGGVIHHASTD